MNYIIITDGLLSTTVWMAYNLYPLSGVFICYLRKMTLLKLKKWFSPVATNKGLKSLQWASTHCWPWVVGQHRAPTKPVPSCKRWRLKSHERGSPLSLRWPLPPSVGSAMLEVFQDLILQHSLTAGVRVTWRPLWFMAATQWLYKEYTQPQFH